MNNIIKESIYDNIPELSEIDRIVIFNVGTPKLYFDSFGPKVGSRLNELINNYILISEYVDVYGTLENPCHAKNMLEKIELIKNVYENLNIFIICLDVCISENDIGKLRIMNQGLVPGRALNRGLPRIGNISILLNTLDSIVSIPTMKKEYCECPIKEGLIGPDQMEAAITDSAESILEAINDKLIDYLSNNL